MKNFSLWLRTKIGKNKRNFLPTSFSNAKHIGILLHNTDFSLNEEINNFVKKLKDGGKQVEVVCFLDKEVNRLYNFPYIELRKKDITVTGGFKEEKLNKFIKTRFDYLYSINNSPFLPFENILKRSLSGTRIGKYFPGSNRYLDLMIDLNQKAGLRELIYKMNELIPNLSFHE